MTKQASNVELRNKPVHFHSSDPRSCSVRHPFRSFTTSDEKVTCMACLGNERYTLSPEGAAYLEQLAAQA